MEKDEDSGFAKYFVGGALLTAIVGVAYYSNF